MIQRLSSKLVKHRDTTLYEKLEALEAKLTSGNYYNTPAVVSALHANAMNLTDLFSINDQEWSAEGAVVIETPNLYHVSCVLVSSKPFTDGMVVPFSFKLPVLPYGGGGITRMDNGLVGSIDAGSGDVGSSLVFNNLGSSTKTNITLDAVFWKRL